MSYHGDLQLLKRVRNKLGKNGMKELIYKTISGVDKGGFPYCSVKRYKELIKYYQGKDSDLCYYMKDRLTYEFNYRGSLDEIYENDHKIKMGCGDQWIKDMMKKRKVWEVE